MTYLKTAFCLLLLTSPMGWGQAPGFPVAAKPKSNRASYNIVFTGNSWIFGTGSTAGKNIPVQIEELLKKDGKTVTTSNYGIAGQTIDQMMGPSLAATIDAEHTKADFLVGLELVNQWGNTSDTKEVILEKYKKYFLARKKAGFKRVIAVTPIAQGYYPRAKWEADRQWFIKTMLADFPKAGIVVANVGADPKLSDWKNTTYFTKDKIHPTNEGYAVMTGIIYDTLVHLE